jgi:hypothetical protein
MTLYELIVDYDGAWTALEDEATEHFWGIEELTSYFNKAEREAAARSLCLRYRHTDDTYGTANPALPSKEADAYCAVTLATGIAEYARNPKIIEILSARIKDEEYPLSIVTRKQLMNVEGEDALLQAAASITETPEYLIAEIGTELLFWPIPDAAYTAYLTVAILPRFPMAVPEYGTDISFDAATKQIRRAAGSFTTHGYQVGGTVNVNGSASNDGDYTITAVAKTALTVSETIEDEAAGATVVVSSSPEIPEQYHRDLIDYVCYLAYKKNGKKTLDLQRAMTHLELFTAVFGPRKTASIEQMRVATQLKGCGASSKYRI